MHLVSGVVIKELTIVNHPLEESFLVERFVLPGSAAESFMLTGQSVPVIHIFRRLLRRVSDLSELGDHSKIVLALPIIHLLDRRSS